MSSGPGWASHWRCRRLSTATLLLLGAPCALLGCGGGVFNQKPALAYATAVEASLDEDWADAAEAAFSYLKVKSPDDPRYDRAMLLLAQSMEQLGLTYGASLWYLDIAESRRNAELLDKAMAGLARIVTGGPHDEETLVQGYLARADITGLNEDNQAFVNYHQGLDAVRQGLDDWADTRFAAITDTSSYCFRARYVLAVRSLGNQQWAEGRKALKQLLSAKDLPLDVQNDSRLALARLAMEENRYGDAVRHYAKVRHLAPTRPGLLLEMAWAHYYLGDSRRALGLLVALDAPVYGGLIAPERYLLEALCLRRLCQFEPARVAAVRLRRRHGDALRDLAAGLRPMDSESLRFGARHRGAVADAWRFRQQLQRERAAAKDLSFGETMAAAIHDMYARAVVEAQRRVEEKLEGEVAALADELVASEDGVRLILHELSVGLLRGRTRPQGHDEVASALLSAEGDITYSFVGEFWTDELDDLVVSVPDRCLE